MTKERAVALAAQCWCYPTTEMIEMDTRLAEVFAQVLMKQVNEALGVPNQESEIVHGA